MYVVIVGSGSVGHYVAQVLVKAGHEVLTIDKNPHRCQLLAEELGRAVVMEGDGSHISVLEAAGTQRAELFIAATGKDEDNLVACQIAKHRFRVPKTVALLHDPRNELLFQKMGVNVIVNLPNMVVSQVEMELPKHPIIPILPLRDKGLEVEEIKIPPDAVAVGRRLRELDLPVGSFVLLVTSEVNGTSIPAPDTVLHAEDELLVLAPPEARGELERVFTVGGGE